MGHLSGVLAHRLHAVANLEARVVLQPQVKVLRHYLVFFVFVVVPNG